MRVGDVAPTYGWVWVHARRGRGPDLRQPRAVTVGRPHVADGFRPHLADIDAPRGGDNATGPSAHSRHRTITAIAVQPLDPPTPMKILVTGTAGFIGSHLAQRLLERGDEVVGIDNLNDYYEVALKEARLAQLTPQPDFRFVRLDIADRDDLAELFLSLIHI